MIPCNTFNPILLILRQSVIFWTGICIIVWVFPSQGIHDLLVYGAFLLALCYAPRAATAWRQPAGLAFIAVLVFLLLSLPFSSMPGSSVRELVKNLDIVAGAFAISVFLNTPDRIRMALGCSALAIVLTLGYDIIRIGWNLPEAWAKAATFGQFLAGLPQAHPLANWVKAHEFKPFIMNHSNVSSMMAGLSALVFIYFLWIWRRRRRLALGCLLGLIVCLAYLVILRSRGPQLAFLLTVPWLGLLIPGWRLKVGLLALGVLLFLVLPYINPRFADAKSMKTFTERTTVWKHTWSLSKQHPWLGHGYGKRTFETVYYASQPPASRFHYPHCHQFWLKLLFEFGWIGLLLNLAAWTILAVQLIRRICSLPTFTDRLLPGTIGLMLLFIHCYGLGDYPDNIVQLAQFWLIPLALALTRAENEAIAKRPADNQS
jgi:O-antigen ligase